ncbi:MAG: VanZ family protein [Isosphaeraceae bacterium]
MHPLTTDDAAPPRDRTASANESASTTRFARSRITLASLWTAVILVLCWAPREYVQEAEENTPWFAIPNFDKVVHWGIFVVFAVLWLRTSGSRTRYLTVALAGLGLAVLTELGQLLPRIGRDASVADGITDLIGLTLGLILARWLEPLLAWLESRILGPADRPLS